MISQKDLIELAKEVEKADPIEWGTINLDKDSTYSLMSLSIVELYKDVDPKLLPITLMATVLKLTVENFVLNVKLLNYD
jgi:hypothetical protein